MPWAFHPCLPRIFSFRMGCPCERKQISQSTQPTEKFLKRISSVVPSLVKHAINYLINVISWISGRNPLLARVFASFPPELFFARLSWNEEPGHPAQTARIHEDGRVPCLPCRKAADRNHQQHQAFRFVLPLVQQRRDRAALCLRWWCKWESNRLSAICVCLNVQLLSCFLAYHHKLY